MSEQITELFAAIIGYAEKRGVRRIGDLPGCWEFEPADGWFVAVNGHGADMACSKGGTPIPPFAAYAEWHGS